MPKEFNCPSCSAPMKFEGGESIFQTCQVCNAPIVIPSDIYYKKEQQLASENFATLTNDKTVDVEKVTNELTPGNSLPKDEDSIDPEAKIEKFEVYQEKIGTHAVEAKKAVDEIIAPKKEVDFKTATPYADSFDNEDGSINVRSVQKQAVKKSPNPVLARVKHKLQTGDKIEAIKIFRNRFNTSLRDAKESVEAIERGEEIDVSQFLNKESNYE